MILSSLSRACSSARYTSAANEDVGGRSSTLTNAGTASRVRSKGGEGDEGLLSVSCLGSDVGCCESNSVVDVSLSRPWDFGATDDAECEGG